MNTEYVNTDVAIPGSPNTDYVEPIQDLGFRSLGRMITRGSDKIKASPWTIGIETLDRDFAAFDPVEPYLLPLGAKKARLQAGWARCEKQAGVYNWAWLDRIVDGVVAAGVEPWLQLSYGNPIYENGGEVSLGAVLPTGSALKAWENWVTALVKRYQDRCRVWEVWNEPDLKDPSNDKPYAELFTKSARIIKQLQPDSHVIGLAMALHRMSGEGESMTEYLLKHLSAAEETYLLDEITFHFYRFEPELALDCFVADIERLVQKYAPHVRLSQGEQGSPSKTAGCGALSKEPWSERKQAVWNLRRMLSHHARGYPMSLFQLVDMHYRGSVGDWDGANSKGLLASSSDLEVTAIKQSYFAAQHIFSILDGRFELHRCPRLPIHASAQFRYDAFVWHAIGKQFPAMVSWWKTGSSPSLKSGLIDTLSIEPIYMKEPVLLDFLSGHIFEIPDTFIFEKIPCTDSPLALIESEFIHI